MARVVDVSGNERQKEEESTMSTQEPPFQPGTPFYMPEILTRLPAKCHPEVARVEEESAAWVRQNLAFAFRRPERLERFLEGRCAYVACSIWPTMRGDWILDAANLSQHLFAFDDAYGDREGIGRDPKSARAVFNDYFAIMAGDPLKSGHPFAKNFQEIWTSIALPMTMGQRDRYRRAVTDWLNNCIREIASRQKGVIFDFDTYMEVRRGSVWSTPCFPIIEHGLGIELPHDIVASRELDELHVLCTDCMILINDLFSFAKEAFEGDYVNAVSILCIQNHGDLQRAVDGVCGILWDAESQFITRRDALLANHPHVHSLLEPYVIALGHYMAGLLLWARMTTRYHGPGYVWNGLTSGIFTFEQTGTILRPSTTTMRTSHVDSIAQ